jgi:predicted Zn-dependent protease
VVVVRGDLPDAVAFPGGKIIVWTGLLRYLGSARPAGPPENQLAVALGHEVVHALARHAAKRIDKEVRQAYALAMQGKDLSDAGADPAAAAALMAAMGVHYEGTVVLPFTSEQESEADHHGLLITARAGYEPAEAVRFWEQIKQRNQGRTPPEFFTKHPDYDMRIEQLKGWMAEARQHYRSPAATLSLASGADGCSNSG